MALSNWLQSLQTRKILGATFFISIVLRVGAALYLGNTVVDMPGTFDQISYHNLAIRLINGHGFTFGQLWWPITPAGEPTAHWSYLYTLYLAAIYQVFGVVPVIARLIQAVTVGVLHPWLAYRLGQRTFGERVGILFALITSVYIYFFYYAASLMTEAFYISGILFALNCAVGMGRTSDPRKKMKYGIGLGLSLGITILLRQLFILLVPLFLLWIWFASFHHFRKVPLKETVIAVTLMLACILPVTAFNYARFGQFVLVNTNAGYAFFWGNHPIYDTKFESILPSKTYQNLIPEEVRHLDEAALDKELLGRGIGFVLEDPVRYLRLSISRIPGYFVFWPSASSEPVSNLSRVFSFGIFLPVMIFGTVKFLREKYFSGKMKWSERLAAPQSLILGFAFVYTVIHVLTWTLIRYRLPVDAVMLLFAAFVLNDLLWGMLDSAHYGKPRLSYLRE